MRRRARLGVTARFVVAGALLTGVLFLGVFPIRTYLDQREAISHSRQHLSILNSENDRLRERIDALQTAEEIERIAREQYNLVLPGEEVFVIIPSELETVRRYAGTTDVVDVLRATWRVVPEP